VDQKQFNIFQEAIQWVADEARHKAEGERSHGLKHLQAEWGMGRTVAERLVAHPSYRVVCATACCVAGNIVLLNGDRFVSDSALPADCTVAVQSCVTAEGDVMDIDDRAIELAGLSEGEAAMLFGGANSWTDIVEMAIQIAKVHGFELEVI
jgi:hypothetical protein